MRNCVWIQKAAYVLMLVVVGLPFRIGPLATQGADAAGIALRPPFEGTYPVNSFFDHNLGDGAYVTIYTGETTVTGDPYYYADHGGIDWGMSQRPILAPADGVVHSRGYDEENAGYWIKIGHQNGYYTFFCHLAQAPVLHPGDPVETGDVIGLSGATGNVTGPHLHFEVRWGSPDSVSRTDPFGWRGSYPDPLLDFPNPGQGHTANCLWRGLPGDTISCFDRIAEDDGAGWSEYRTWYHSLQGNGRREHHTYTWAAPSAWAQWDAPILDRGYYQVAAYIAEEPPSITGPGVQGRTHQADYQIRHAFGEITTDPIDQSAYTHEWVDLGTYQFDASIYQYVHIDDHTGEPQGQYWVQADSMRFSAEVTYLPSVRKVGGWTTIIEIRNLTAEWTHVGINYYNLNGELVSFVNVGLSPQATEYRSPPNNFDGLAVVVSSVDVAVIARQECDDRVTAYTGISEANWNTGWGQPGTEIYVPTVFWYPTDWDDTLWHTTLYMQNAGTGDAEVSITYYDRNGDVKGTYTNIVPVNGSIREQPYYWGYGYDGGAYIRSTQPLAVVVTQEDAETQTVRASQYNAFSSGANTVYLPSVMRSWYYWTSSFTVQNIGDEPATIEVYYYGEEGEDWQCTLTNLEPNRSCIVVQDQEEPVGACPVEQGDHCDVPMPDPPGPGFGWEGSVVLESTQPIVAIANQELYNLALNHHSHQSYSGFVGGGTVLHSPFAAHHWAWFDNTYRSASHVQNVGSTWVNVSSMGGYFGLDGTVVSGAGSTVWLGGGEVAMFYVPVEPGIPSGFRGSVTIDRTWGDSPIAGIHNYARAVDDGEEDDAGASFNMPQR